MGRSFLVSIVILVSSSVLLAKTPDRIGRDNVKYRTYIGSCPSKSAGMLTVILMKEFEKSHSLKDVKEKILNEKLDEKYFLSDYRMNYNPITRTLKIQIDCPHPLAKIQVYKANGEEHYSAILGDNAKLYEPQYENLMKAEKKLNFNLPLLAMTTEQLDGDAPKILTEFIRMMDENLRRQISEILFSKNSELTIVFSLGGKATSVFMGADFWEEKLLKLNKIIGYISKNKRYPTSINLVNAKKVVVKFSDKI